MKDLKEKLKTLNPKNIVINPFQESCDENLKLTYIFNLLLGCGSKQH